MESAPQIPIPDRIRFLDALRGIAVLCIYIANIAYFSGIIFIDPAERLPSAVLPTDNLFDFICFTLIDGKFYTIFSLLFGIGCAVQYDRLSKRNLPFRPFFTRRMFWLLIIGGIHLCLIWLGDILALYAILGFILVVFVDAGNRKLIRWAIVLILLPILNDFLINFVGFDYPNVFRRLNDTLATSFHSFDWAHRADYLKNDNWAMFFKTNLSNWPIRIARILHEGRAFKVLGIFFIGLWAGRKIINDNLLTNVALLKKVAIWGICIGLPLCTLRTYIEFFKDGDAWGFIKTVVYAFGTVPLALAYAALLALQYRKRSAFMVIFEPVGKMALTNYLLQTLISITIFYGVGFGLAGKLGFTIVLGIGLAVFVFQIVASTVWLSKFSQGPIEWFWRRMTKADTT